MSDRCAPREWLDHGNACLPACPHPQGDRYWQRGHLLCGSCGRKVVVGARTEGVEPSSSHPTRRGHVQDVDEEGNQ
jgi:hypothetical protein